MMHHRAIVPVAQARPSDSLITTCIYYEIVGTPLYGYCGTGNGIRHFGGRIRGMCMYYMLRDVGRWKKGDGTGGGSGVCGFVVGVLGSLLVTLCPLCAYAFNVAHTKAA